MVLHGLKRIFQKPSPDLSSSERTNQLRSKTIYSGTVNLSTALAIPGSNRYKTYNGPFEVVNDNGNSSLVASASYSDLLDITKGKVLSSKLPLTDSSFTYYEKNFGNGEMYVGNYQQFDGSDGSLFNAGPTGCHNSVLVYDMSTTGFTGPGSYISNSIGYLGVTGSSNQDIFVDPKHCYYSDSCASSASYMKFVDINFKGPTGPVGATGITGASQYYAQKIINGDQYSGFRFPMSNFSLITCAQQNQQQTDGPLFCPPEPPSLSGFSLPPQLYSPTPIHLSISPPHSNSGGAITYYSSNPSAAFISGPNLDMVTIIGAGTFTITAFQAAYGSYSSGSTTAPLIVAPASPGLSSFTSYSGNYSPTPSPFQIIPPNTLSQGASFSYTSSDTSIVAINGNMATTGNVGTVIITATQAANGNYTSDSISTNYTVLDIPPTFTHDFIIADVPYNSTPFQLTPPTSTNLEGAFSFTVISGPSPPPSISNITTVDITGVNVGTYTILATQAAAGNYGSMTQPASFNVTAILPIFTSDWITPSTVPYNSSPFQITPPTSTSGGAFSSYIVTGPSPLPTISNNTVNISGVNVGTYTINATQEAYGNYAPRSTPSVSFGVTAITPTISFSLSSIGANSPPVLLTNYTTSDSGGAFIYTSSSSIATISNNATLTLADTSTSGVTNITVYQASYGNYTGGTNPVFILNVTPPLSILYSQDMTDATQHSTGLVFPKVTNLGPGITIYGGTVNYFSANTAAPLTISFGYINQGVTMHTESFTITNSTGIFDFILNPPLEWIWPIEYSINDPNITIWPDVSWSQPAGSNFESYYVLADPSYESRWVGTLTYYNTPPPPPP
jgi:hypothetical protein